MRQDRVLYRREQGRLDSKQQQRGEQERQTLEQEPAGAQSHATELDTDGCGNQSGLVPLVGELASGGGKQKERQHEERLGDVLHGVRAQRRESRGLVGEHDDKRLPEQMPVEGAEELHAEEWTEAPLGQQRELAASSHAFAHLGD